MGTGMIPEDTRREIRRAHAELQEAVRAREAVTRPDGTNGHGHPGIRAANLEGWLGRFTVPLLDALEAAEAREMRARDLRWRMWAFLAVLVAVGALVPSPWSLLAATGAYLILVMPVIR